MSNLTITSTTSSQEELDHAASENWREPFVPKPAEETKAPEGEAPEVETAPETPEAKEEQPKPKEHKAGWQKRIDKLTARNHRLEAEVEELRKKATAPEAKPAQSGPVEPKLADFNNDVEKYVKARDEFKANQERAQNEQEQQKAVYDEYNKKVSEARGNYDDWDEVVEAASRVQIPQGAYLAVVHAKNGPDVAYYLATHPEEAQALNELNQIDVVFAIRDISNKLAADKKAPAAPKAKVAPPAPVAPVGGSATRGNVPLEEMSIREYIKIRNKQERENRR